MMVDTVHYQIQWESTLKYVIYGAGAIGGTIGARLHREGKPVTLIARGDHLKAIRENGLRYRNPVMDEYLPIPAAGHPGELEYDLDTVVYLTMKSQHTRDALLDLAGAAPPETAIVCCQNGVANERMALRRFKDVYGMVVVLPATHLTPGEVVHNGDVNGGLLDAGRYPLGSDNVIETITGDLTAAGFVADADPRAMRWKYAKLLQNLGNALQAVADAGPDAKDVMKCLRDEALDCYEAAGIECASVDETRERFTKVTMSEVPGIERSGGSSWQSMARGTGDIEADYLNGEISLLGRLHQVPTPANDLMCRLANRAARERTPPGSVTLDDIRKELAL